MKRVELNEDLYDQMIEETSDDPLYMVPEELVHLIPAFLQRREMDVQELGEFLRRREFEGVRMIGHRLKGMGTGYGFPIVTEIGRDLEAAANDSSAARVQSSIEKLSTFNVGLKMLLTRNSDD